VGRGFSQISPPFYCLSESTKHRLSRKANGIEGSRWQQIKVPFARTHLWELDFGGSSDGDKMFLVTFISDSAARKGRRDLASLPYAASCLLYLPQTLCSLRQLHRLLASTQLSKNDGQENVDCQAQAALLYVHSRGSASTSKFAIEPGCACKNHNSLLPESTRACTCHPKGKTRRAFYERYVDYSFQDVLH